MKEEQISIIVPVYNVEQYLEKCVTSLQNQTYKLLQIILVDDGSTDRSGEICDSLAQTDSRIQVIHKENGGSSSARNVGIAHATGEYLGFVDSDDYVEPTMYEELYGAVTEFQVLCAQVGRDEISTKGEKLPDICIPPECPQILSAKTVLKELLLHRGDCSFCTKLFHRSIFEETKPNWFPEGALNEDFHFLVTLLPKLEKIVSLPNQSYHVFYRLGSNSRKESREVFPRVFGDNVVNADWIEEMVSHEYPAFRKIARRFGVFQRIDYLLHIPIGQMNRDNREYREVVGYLRKHCLSGLLNPYLTLKNKLYLLLFVTAPKGVRRIHKRIRRL